MPHVYHYDSTTGSGHHTGEVIAKLADDAYYMRVNNRVTPAANHEATSRSCTTVDGGRNRVSGEYEPTLNRSRASAGGPSHGGHSGGCGGGGSSGNSSSLGGKRAGGDGDHGGRGPRTATPLATHTVATTPATGSTRSTAPRRLIKSAIAMTSPPTQHDFAICSFPGNSNLSESLSTTRSKTRFIENAGGNNDMKCLYFPFCLDQAPLTWLESLDKNSID
jgi:hypothetical protein